MSKKIENILNLIERMQSSAEGLTLCEIQEIYGIARSTAERYRNQIAVTFPTQIEEVINDGKIKRWKLRGRHRYLPTTVNAVELAELKNAVNLFGKNNMIEQADRLETLYRKVQALITPDKVASLNTDLDALLMSEGFAMRPGPKPKIAVEIVQDLRHAFLLSHEVQISYRTRLTKRDKLTVRTVQPYGVLYGNRHYLVAFNAHAEKPGFRLYSLSNIRELKITDTFFERDPEFNLDTFAKNSFGVFQEPPFDVCWHFTQEVAEDVAAYEFHPAQTLEWQKDGSLMVRFRAGGRVEMDWELYRWGDTVSDLTDYPIADISPDYLKRNFNRGRKKVKG